jgi:hypothetical protein
MYNSIPTLDAIDIITNVLKINSETDENSQKVIIHTLKTVTEHNYFHFGQQYYKQTDG